MLRKCNKYIDDTMPWSLAKDENNKDRLKTVIYNLLESIRVCAIHLNPFLTSTSFDILKQLNIQDEDNKFNKNNEYINMLPSVLFARIDEDKKLKEIKESE